MKLRAILGVIFTIIIAVIGISTYSSHDGVMTWFGIELSEPVFYILIAVFAVFDVIAVKNAFGAEKKAVQAQTEAAEQAEEAEAPSNLYEMEFDYDDSYNGFRQLKKAKSLQRILIAPSRPGWKMNQGTAGYIFGICNFRPEIMMNPPEKNRNTILRYKMTPSTVGKPGEIYELNTFNAIFVNLGGDYDESLPKELKFMSALFMNGLTENERKDLMTKTYKISAKEYPSKELRQMGVFGEDCKRRYTREGYAQGLAEGKAEGRLESKVDIVMSLISRGYTEEDALEIVQATPEELEEICNRIHNP